MSNKSTLKFLVYASIVFLCYFLFGLIQEKIMRGKYGDGESFTCALCLVLFQCVINFFFAKFLMFRRNDEHDTTPISYYFSSALTYLLAMVCSNMALQWVNYPTQVVGKAAKPIPVMVLGVLLGRKTYALKKYVFVFLIVTGVGIFIYKDQSNKTDTNGGVYGIGELLLILSLLMDGLTGAVQERIRSESSPTAFDMMMNTNKWSCIILSIGVIMSGEIFDFSRFVMKHPEVFVHILGLSVTGAVGQLFIFYLVSGYGPLPCSVVTTTRKFFTVLASVIFYGNVLLPRQWVGAVLVFTGLFLDMFYGKTPSKSGKVPVELIKPKL